jgi:hypothetical protein
MAGGIPMAVCTGILIVSVRARCTGSIAGADAAGDAPGDAAGAGAAGAGATDASLAAGDGDGDGAGLAATALAAETDEASPSILSSEAASSVESGSELAASSEEPSAGFCLRA